MAEITWKHPKPAVNPFGAVVGDYTKYSVHVCAARAHKGEESTILQDVLIPALQAAQAVERAEARFILFDFDAVYSALTIVVTDRDRTRDEREVYKLIYHDWDDEVLAITSDSARTKRYDEFQRQMYSLLESALRSDVLAGSVQMLKSRGFTFWFSDGDSESEWKSLEV